MFYINEKIKLQKKLFFLSITISSIILSSCATNVPDLPLSKIVCNQKKDNIIIFVHGLTGDLKTTWTNEESGSYWPNMICTDSDLKNYDVAVVNYYSRIFNNKFTLKELGLWLNAELSNIGILGTNNYKNIIFIGHSQGSLVVRAAIKEENYKYNTKKVFLLVSLASPSKGSALATIGKVLVPTNTSFSNLASGDNYEVFVLNSSWQKLKGNTKISCAYEKLDTSIIGKVVDESSASAICQDAPVPFYANHISISKPKNKNDRIYIWTKNEILKAEKEITERNGNFVNMYSEEPSNMYTEGPSEEFENNKEINIKQMIESAEKINYSDIPKFIFSNIKNIKNGVSCENFYEIYKHSYYRDALSIVKFSSKYIKRPINDDCLQNLIDHVIYQDREEASTILINSN